MLHYRTLGFEPRLLWLKTIKGVLALLSSEYLSGGHSSFLGVR